MKRTTIALASALALAAVSAAYAGEGAECGEGKSAHHGHSMKLEGVDADGNGKVTLEEFRAVHDGHVQEKFSRIDADGDGTLTQEEMTAAKEKGRAHHHGGGKTGS